MVKILAFEQPTFKTLPGLGINPSPELLFDKSPASLQYLPDDSWQILFVPNEELEQHDAYYSTGLVAINWEKYSSRIPMFSN